MIVHKNSKRIEFYDPESLIPGSSIKVKDARKAGSKVQ